MAKSNKQEEPKVTREIIITGGEPSYNEDLKKALLELDKKTTKHVKHKVALENVVVEGVLYATDTVVDFAVKSSAPKSSKVESSED